VDSAKAGHVIRLLTDEDLDGRIVGGLEMHYAEIDLVRVQETAAFQQEDEVVLAVAAWEDRVLIAHDLAAIPVFAAQRIAAGEPMRRDTPLPANARSVQCGPAVCDERPLGPIASRGLNC
jgi:hypothetical protein